MARYARTHGPFTSTEVARRYATGEASVLAALAELAKDGRVLEGEFRPHIAERLCAALDGADEDCVVALLGVASLYGFLRVSELIRSVEQSIHGRLVVFFPGTKNENNYRLLDARDGWNYLAQGITLHGGGLVP